MRYIGQLSRRQLLSDLSQRYPKRDGVQSADLDFSCELLRKLDILSCTYRIPLILTDVHATRDRLFKIGRETALVLIAPIKAETLSI